jgi:hypothetical protein
MIGINSLVYVKLLDTMFIGQVKDYFGDGTWDVLMYPIHPRDADKDDEELYSVGFVRSRSKMKEQYMTLFCPGHEAEPAVLDSHYPDYLSVQAMGKELARIPYDNPHPTPYKYAADTACEIRDKFNKQWRHVMEYKMIRKYFNELATTDKPEKSE